MDETHRLNNLNAVSCVVWFRRWERSSTFARIRWYSIDHEIKSSTSLHYWVYIAEHSVTKIGGF